MPLINLNHAEIFVDGLDHPEGVAVGMDGHIYAGGEAGQIYRIEYHTRQVEHYAMTKGMNLGLALDASGSVYVCNPGDHSVKKVAPSGAVSVYSAGNANRPMITPNYLSFDRVEIFMSLTAVIGKQTMARSGALAPGGNSTIIETDSSQFPNGCAISPDGCYLYVAMF